MREGATPKVPDGMSARVAQRADMPESCCGPAHRSFFLVAFAFIALLGAQLLLVTSIPGTNYDGADGMAAQAEILTTMEFAKRFDITNLNPLQGLWPQMMPMNVWVNPAYWPFAFFHRDLAADVSGSVALICYAVACYLMARLFDLPRPSVVAAQLSILLFAPVARALAFSGVFISIPGLAVVYAPHLVALGLARKTFAKSTASFHHCRRHTGAAVLQPVLRSIMDHGQRCGLDRALRGRDLQPASPRHNHRSVRGSRRLRGRVVAKRCARIRVFIVAVHRPCPISGITAAPTSSRDHVALLPVQVRKGFLLGVCAWMGARHLAAARPTTNPRRGYRDERPFVSCLFYRLFVFAR